MSIVVSDTSPVRALAHLGHLELLRTLFGSVVIPPAVVAELELPRLRFSPLHVRDWPFLQIQAPRDRSAVDELLRTLELGESEAIVLAVEMRAEAILIDESAGRAIARERGLQTIGVLGTLIRGRQRGLVGAVRPLVRRLETELGFFVSEALREEILRQAGELGGED